MDNLEIMLDQFNDRHPVWFWILIRLTICFCWMFTVIAVLLALFAVIAPFFGAIIGVWLLIPVFIVAGWGLGSFALWLYSEFVDSW